MKNQTNGTEPVYYISLPFPFDSIIEAEKYQAKHGHLRGHQITYYMPQPKIPIWVIRILKFLNLYN